MPAPKSNAGFISDIVKAEVQRLYDKSCGAPCESCGRPSGAGLSDEDLARLVQLTRVSKMLTAPVSPQQLSNYKPDADELVKELKAKRDPTLFPKKGQRTPTLNAVMGAAKE